MMTELSNETMSKTKKQYMWIVREGLVNKYPRKNGVFPADCEIDPYEGTEHAKFIGQRLARDHTKAPAMVYTSPLVRTVHTAQLVTLELLRTAGAASPPRVRVEEGLTEWLGHHDVDARSTLLASSQQTGRLAQRYGTIDLSYQSLNPAIVPKAVQEELLTANTSDADSSSDATPDLAEEEECPGSPRFPETEQDFLYRCATTLNRLVEHQGTENFCIVSHAPCDQAMASHLLSSRREGSSTNGTGGRGASMSIGPWPCGGVSLYSRDINEDGTAADGGWTQEYYGCTQHMPGKYKAGLYNVSLPSLTNTKGGKHTGSSGGGAAHRSNTKPKAVDNNYKHHHSIPLSLRRHRRQESREQQAHALRAY